MSALILIRFHAHLVECRLLKPTSLCLNDAPTSFRPTSLFSFGWRVVYRSGWVGLFHMATHAHDITRPPLSSVRSIFVWTVLLGGLCRLVLPVLLCPLFGTPAHVARLSFGSAHRTFPFAVRSTSIVRRVACPFGRSASAVRPCRSFNTRRGWVHVRVAHRPTLRVKLTFVRVLRLRCPPMCIRSGVHLCPSPMLPDASCVTPVKCLVVSGRPTGPFGSGSARRRSGRPLSCGAPSFQGVTQLKRRRRFLIPPEIW